MLHKITDIRRCWSVWVLLAGIAALATSLSCTRPELIGADLLADEASQVGFTDTISLHCRITRENSVRTYIAGTGRQIIRGLVGHLDDPVFGKSEAQLYSEIFLLSGSAAFLGRTIDSVVVSLRYDTNGVYGDLSQPVELSLHLMEEQFNIQENIRSDFAPMISVQPSGVSMIDPRPQDSLYIMSRGDSLKVPPMARIRLNDQFIETLLAQDTATFLIADSFRTFLKGVHLRMHSMTPNTMLSFDLRSTWSRLTVYYNNGADVFSNEVSFAFTDQLGFGIHHTYIAHDYTGAQVQQYLDGQTPVDSLLFVQGMSGVNLEISLPGLPGIGNIALNKAELEFYAADQPDEQLDLFPRTTQLINAVKRSGDDIESSEDVQLVFAVFGRLDFFGGNLMDTDSLGATPKKYVMNVTTTLQDIYKERIDNRFYIIPFVKPNVPHRVVLYGPTHPQYAPRLRLYYTVVN